MALPIKERRKSMETTNDLTQGQVGKTLIKYAIPMVLTSLMQSLYSIADMVIVGQCIGGNAVSAVNNGSLIMTLLMQIAIGFTVGGNIVIGQYFGAKKPADAKQSAGTLFLTMLTVGLIGALAVFALSTQLLILLDAPALTEASVYLRICALGIPAICLYNAFNATLRAVGNSRKPFHFIACSTTLNIVLDLVFVVVFQWGIFGTALATMLSQWLSCLLALHYVYRHRDVTGFTPTYLHIDPAKLRLIVKYGIPIMLQYTIASVSWLGIAFLFNQYGVDASAGNGISNKIKEFCQLFLSATTSAAATMAAQNIGAREFERAKQVMWAGMKIMVSIAAICIVICQLFAPTLVGLFIDDATVASYAVTNLRIEIFAQVFYAAFYAFNVLATGSGHTTFVMFNSFLNCILVRLVLGVLFNHFCGLHGIYWACMIAPSVSVPVGYWFYKTNRWRATLQ